MRVRACRRVTTTTTATRNEYKEKQRKSQINEQRPSNLDDDIFLTKM
jgi:hypothetical protein